MSASRIARIATMALVVALAFGGCVGQARPSGSGSPSAGPGSALAWSMVGVEQPGDVAAELARPVFCSPCHAASSTAMTGVTAGKPGLVAVGYALPGPVAAVWTSTDGREWQRDPAVQGAGGGALEAVAAAGSHLVAVGSSATGAGAWTSGDGRTWTPAASVALPGRPGLSAMQAVLSWGGMLVAGGYADPDAATHEAAAWTSHDGTVWTRVPDGPAWRDARVFDLAAYRGGLIAVGSAGGVDRAGAAVWLSTDGRTWERISSPAFAAGSMRSVASDGSTLVAVGVDAADDGAVAWTSPDGHRWSVVPHGPAFQNYGLSARILSLLHTGGGWLAAGWVSSAANGSGTIWSSPDGRAWTRVSPSPAMLGGGAADLTVAGSRIVVVGSTGWPDNITAAAWLGVPSGGPATP